MCEYQEVTFPTGDSVSVVSEVTNFGNYVHVNHGQRRLCSLKTTGSVIAMFLLPSGEEAYAELFEYKTNKSYFSRLQGLWSNLINRFSACFFQNSINSCFPWLKSSRIQRVGSLNPATGAQVTLPRDQTQQKCGLNWFKFLRVIRPGAVPCILVAAQALQKTHCHSDEQVSS